MEKGPRLFLDIRSGSVACAVVSAAGEKDGPAKVTYSTRRNLPILHTFKGERLLSAMHSEILELLLGVRKHDTGPFRGIYVTVGAPWFMYKTQTIKHSSPDDTVSDRDWLRKAESSLVADFLERNFLDRKPELIERYLLRATLNGYETKFPYGKLAREHEFTFYISAIEATTASTISRALYDVFGQQANELHTLPIMALPAARKSISADMSSYILLDIGGEVSEFFLIQDGILLESFSIPVGAHAVLRTISKDLRTSTDEARSVYDMYGEGGLGDAIRVKVERSLDTTTLQWKTYTKSIIERIALNNIIPPVVVLICTERTGGIFQKVFESSDLAELFPQKSTPLIVRPTAKSLGVSFSGAPGKTSEDVFLALEISSVDNLAVLKYPY